MSVKNHRGRLTVNRSQTTGNDTKRNQSTGNDATRTDATRTDKAVRQANGNQAVPPAVKFPLPSARSFL